jgi:hypothetical protein
MPLQLVDDSQQPLEEACHEGNDSLRNMLSAARWRRQATTMRRTPTRRYPVA